jgi:predicted RNase H-like nuclease
MAIVGIDACKSGWIAITLRGATVSAIHLRRIDELDTAIPDAEVVAIDIPIGPPTTGRRLADIEAKTSLGKRASTLFVVPVRAALEAPTHSEATRLSRELSGFGISQQAYALAPKILEVERWLSSAPCPVWEVHPELSFAELQGAVMMSSKKSWAGMLKRRGALLRVGIDLDDVAGDAGEWAATDDMLDAAVAAWSRRRISEGRARSIPAVAPIDPLGREIAIWI